MDKQILRQSEAPFLPKAREAELIVREIESEVLIYDLDQHRAHCLNQMAAQVWRSCDGRKGVEEIARHLAVRNSAEAEEVVWLALAQLDRADLLETPLPSDRRKRHSRREMLRRLGRAAIIGLPLVTSLLAPTAAQAGSYCASSGEMCVTVPCCAGFTCVGGVCQ